jgi:hypothetical protein
VEAAAPNALADHDRAGRTAADGRSAVLACRRHALDASRRNPRDHQAGWEEANSMIRVPLPKVCSEETEFAVLCDLVVAAVLGPAEVMGAVNETLKQWKPMIVKPNGRRILR